MGSNVTCERVSKVLDLCSPLNPLSALVATHEIMTGLSGASAFELLVVAQAEVLAREIEAAGKVVNYDAVIERVRRTMRSSPPWSSELWDVSFNAAFVEIAEQWRKWRTKGK